MRFLHVRLTVTLPCIFFTVLLCMASHVVAVQGQVGSGRALLVTANAEGWGSPAIAGKIVIWARARSSRVYAWGTFASIHGKDLQTGREFPVTANTALVGRPVTNGHLVAWEDCRRCSIAHGLPGFINTGIYVKSLTSNREFEITTTGQVEEAPAISGNTLVWIEHLGSSVNVRGEDLSTRRQFVVAIGSNMKASAVVANHTVAWAEMQNGGWNIVVMNISNGRRFVVARHSDRSYLTEPVISGSRLIWTAWNSDHSVSIRGIDLLKQRRFWVVTIQPNRFNPEVGPAKTISKASVLWNQTSSPLSSRDAHVKIHGRNLVTHGLFVLKQGSVDQLNPSANGKILAWFTKRGQGYLHGFVYVASVP